MSSPNVKVRHGKKPKKAKALVEGCHEEVLRFDIQALRKAVPENDDDLPPRFTEVELEIEAISSTGDGLGRLPGNQDHIVVVPFCVPGDFVRVRLVHHHANHYSTADLVRVERSGRDRQQHLVQCRYFASCGGCQWQMMPYAKQLLMKKSVVEKAYRNFSGLTPESVPVVADTIASPLQYGYRTKLTPHFDGPPGAMSRKNRKAVAFESVPSIGFQVKGMRRTIDVEDCPIGTDAVRRGLVAERRRVAQEIHSYRRGATLLLRESTEIQTLDDDLKAKEESTEIQILDDDLKGKEAKVDESLKAKEESTEIQAVNESFKEEAKVDESLKVKTHAEVDDSVKDCRKTRVEADDGLIDPVKTQDKICITDSNAIATEYVDRWVFKNSAGAFFQNNNSILPCFTAYIREHIQANNIRHLIDAYCGSGLFTVTLSSLFSSSVGIDIAEPSIVAARNNARLNGIENASFMTADAAKIFDKVTFSPDCTAMVIDPPRKGCDGPFLRQLLAYGPARVVYVSCNVHTQARDVGILVEGHAAVRYQLESLQGFDFFPQTAHVESVAILRRFHVH